MKQLLYLILLLLMVPVFADAQLYVYAGKVLDSKTRKPLAFVSVTISGQNKGTQSDIDGKFRVTSVNPNEELRFAFVGYETKIVSTPHATELSISLADKSYEIKEVVVIAGENPAHRIIRRATDNRAKNNPEKLTSFQYYSYNKFYFTGTRDTTAKPGKMITLKDTLDIPGTPESDSIREANLKEQKRMDDFFNSQYVFLSESVSERTFLYPDLNNEVIKASKVSGLKNPQFVLMASQFQSFSFYKDYINILDKNYLSPISPGSTSKYFFTIEDTLYNNNDSVFVISFKPRKGKNFDGLKGLLYINTNGYAIQNVIAEPEMSGLFTVKIQQQYEFIDHKYWFPTQLNTDLDFSRSVQLNDRKMVGVGRTYIRDITVGVPLRKRDLSNISIDYDKKSISNSAGILDQYRVDTLSDKDRKTYHVIDSVSKAQNIEQKIKVYSVLTKGYIPMGYINMDLNKFIAVNNYEGLRLGVGINTSDKISDVFSVGAYGAYGIKDDGFKYGGNLDLHLYKRNNVKLALNYKKDVSESGAVNFRGERIPFTEKYRNLVVENMDKIELKEVSLGFRSLNYLTSVIFVNEITKEVTTPYRFIKHGTFDNRFTYQEIGVTFRYAFRERLMRQAEQIVSTGTKYPVLWLQLTNGFDNLSDLNTQYTKIDAKVQKTFTIRNAGKTSVTAQAGYIDGDVPYPFAYNGKGNDNGKVRLVSDNSFQAMGMNEFLSSEYSAVFIAHDFGQLLFKSKYIKPQFTLIANGGWGTLNNRSQHTGVPIKTMEKGYYEGGLRVSHLFAMESMGMKQGLGIGTFYRMGAYASAKAADNLVFKLDYKISF
jgi:ribosomal protein S13